MKVLVRDNFIGEPLKLEFDLSPQDTVANLKSLIEEADGALPYQQRLIWSGKHLMHLDASLESYGMRDEGEGKVHRIILVRPSGVPLEVAIRTKDTAFNIKVKTSHRLSDLKDTIERVKGWKASEQELLLELDDEDYNPTLKDLRIDDSVVLLLVAKEGTKLHEELGGLREMAAVDVEVEMVRARAKVEGGSWREAGVMVENAMEGSYEDEESGAKLKDEEAEGPMEDGSGSKTGEREKK